MQLLITSVILLLTLLLNVTLATLVLRKNGYRKRINQIFGLHLLGIIGWTFFILIIIWLPHVTGQWNFVAGDLGYSIEKLIFFFATILISTNYWFAHYFVFRRFTLTLWTGAVLCIQFSTLVLSLLNDIFYTTVAIQPQGYASLTIEPMNLAYTLFLLSHLILPLGLLAYGWYQNTDLSKQPQYPILFSVYLIFLLASITLNWVLPVYYNIFLFNAFGPTISLIVVVGIAFAVIKYQFLDITVVIQRGLIYTVLFTFITLIYVVLLTITGLFFDNDYIIDDFFSGLLTSIIGIFTVPTLDRYLRRKTDRWFYKDTYNYTTVMRELSTVLQSSLELDTLLPTCEQSLAEVLRASFVKIVPEKTSLQQPPDTIMIPIKLNHKLTGAIVVGPKKSGAPYSITDQNLLTTFANQAAVAMSRTFLYQEVKRRADELEIKVAERTQELQTEQEKQRTMMLHISHNLQTPLAILQTKIEHLRKTAGDSAVKNLEQSLQQTSQFIVDLLTLARLEGGYENPTLTTCNLSQHLQDIADEVQIVAATNQVIIHTNISPNLSIVTDSKYVHEIMINVLSNAIKYIGDQPPKEITIGLHAEAEAVMITVSDTGIGIPTDDLQAIFNDFYRGENQTVADGTGLGLSITKEKVALLGGTITASNNTLGGTTFTISLPATPISN